MAAANTKHRQPPNDPRNNHRNPSTNRNQQNKVNTQFQPYQFTLHTPPIHYFRRIASYKVPITPMADPVNIPAQ